MERVKLSVEPEALDRLERAYYLAQATKALYLEAKARGVAEERSRAEYVKAFVELDQEQCAMTARLEREHPGLRRWDANFRDKCIEAVMA